jgi:thymidylate kinase
MPGAGTLIALEGPDGEQIAALHDRLYSWLQDEGVAVERAQMPTRGPIGLLVRLQQQGRLDLDLATLALLWTADRLDLLGRSDGVRAWLSAGRVVLCAHYRLRAYAALSGTTGQPDHADRLDPRWLSRIDAPCPAPDLTLYLAPPAAQAAQGDPYARALAMAAQEGERVARLPAGRTPDEADRACRAHIAALLA